MVNLIVLTIILSCAIVLCLGVVGILLSLCLTYKEQIEELEDPLEPPVKSWVDTYYEVR